MGSLRFFRRVKLMPGLSLNFSKSGPSVSMGARGAHVTVGPRGVRRTVGLPGTGLFYTSRSGHHTGTHTSGAFTTSARPDTHAKLLAELDHLHDAGVLTDAEYTKKRGALTPDPPAAP